MHGLKKRRIKQQIQERLSSFPVVALLGARQVGKSTLAKSIIREYPHSLYLDLENPNDRARLESPLRFLEENKEKLICIDEVQLFPQIFSIFRSYVDQTQRNGQLLLLGSASRDLIKQSSQTLAGRISYIEINPFDISEVDDWRKLWVQGGYPRSYLNNEKNSYQWRIDYIRTFLERDIPQLGFNIPASQLNRFWKMLAHSNSSILNQAKLASSMGLSKPTIKNYIDILEGTFVIRQLMPFHSNLKKRLVKSPKIYIRDTGLIHTLLSIENYHDLLGHPALGGSYEAFIIQNLIDNFLDFQPSFYRTSNGAEIDLVLSKGEKHFAFEIKSSSTQKPSKGFWESLKVIKPQKSFVISPTKDPYFIKDNVWNYNIESILKETF